MKKSKFNKPPIVELICGAQFDPIPLLFPIASKFYDEIKEDYPNIEEKTPLPTNFDFDSLETLKNTSLSDFETLIRFWFINRKGDRVLQLQNNKLNYNWRKNADENNIYPKFDKVFENFKKSIDLLSTIIKRDLEFNQLELTYIDHISVNDFISDNDFVTGIFNFFTVSDLIKNIDHFKVEISQKVEACEGHYNFKAYTAFKGSQKDLVIVFNSNVTGAINEHSDTIEKWFNAAHDVINEKFMNQISEKAKIIWELQQ